MWRWWLYSAWWHTLSIRHYTERKPNSTIYIWRRYNRYCNSWKILKVESFWFTSSAGSQGYTQLHSKISFPHGTEKLKHFQCTCLHMTPSRGELTKAWRTFFSKRKIPLMFYTFNQKLIPVTTCLFSIDWLRPRDGEGDITFYHLLLKYFM
jgi:hypothetical protein